PPGGIAALAADQSDEVRENLVIEPNVEGRLDKPHVAASARTVLLELDKEAVGRVFDVVEGIVSERIADRGYKDRSCRQLFADRQRGFAVLQAVLLHWIRRERKPC